MGKSKKSTKKFLSRGLEKEYEKRNKAKPLKKKIALHNKRAAEKNARGPKPKGPKPSPAQPLEAMNVDDFMAKGFMDSFDGSSDESGLDLDDEVEGDDLEGEDVPAGQELADGEDDEDEDDEDESEGDGEEDDGGVEVSAGVDDFMAHGLNDSSDDDAEEDSTETEEAAAQAPGKLKSEISTHKSQLERLKAAQPEFYEYLKENDEDLLAFAEESSGSEEGDSDEGEAEGSEDEAAASEEGEAAAEAEAEAESRTKKAKKAKDQAEKAKAKTVSLSSKTVREWGKLMKGFGIPAFKRSVRAFYEACASADDQEDEENEEGDDDDRPHHGVPKRRYRLQSATTFNVLTKTCFRYIPALLDHHLPMKQAKPGRGAPLPCNNNAWKKFKGPVKVFLQSVLKLLDQLSDPDAQCFVLNSTIGLCPYFASYPKINRALFKKLLALWGQGAEGAEQTRVAAFLVIRKMTIVSPYPFIEVSLKGIYLAFVRNCKFPTPALKPTLTFMLNSVVELYCLDEHASYQHAFVYIRQLAVHLRNAISLKKKESFQQVYNWQYLFAIKVWAKLLCQASTLPDGAGEKLQPLVYPLVQTVIGAIKLLPTAKYFPIRFHFIEVLVGMMQKIGVYIPLSGLILSPLNSSEMRRRAKPSTDKPINFDNLLRATKAMVDTRQFQEATLARAFELAMEFYHAIAYSVSFPECVFPDLVRIRKALKQNKAKQVAGKLRPLLEKLEENAGFIESQRAHVTFAPKDTDEITKWRAELEQQNQSPFARYYRVWRAGEDNRKSMQASTQVVDGDDFEEAEPTTKKAKKRAAAAAAKAEEAAQKKQRLSVASSVDGDDGEDGDDVSDGDNDDDGDSEDDLVGTFSMEDFELDD